MILFLFIWMFVIFSAGFKDVKMDNLFTVLILLNDWGLINLYSLLPTGQEDGN